MAATPGDGMTAVEHKLLQLGEALEGTIDAELQKLEQPDELERIRQRRMEELKRRAAQQGQWKSRGHGEYQELQSERDFFGAAKESENVVCHFFRDNRPCRVLDEHLAVLAREHLETKFMRLNAEKSPYLTEKLKIRMLPTLALLRAGKVVDYVVGFDELGGQESFPTEVLEARLIRAGVLDGESALTGPSNTGNSSVRKGGLFD